MAILFQVVNKTVQPNVETLAISPFSEIWSRDKSKDKEIALKEFAYIEFMSSQLKSNPFKDYPDGEKSKKILEAIKYEESLEHNKHINLISADILIEKAIEFIRELQTNASSTYRLYAAAMKARDELEKFLTNLDMQDIDPKSGKPLWKPKEITSAMMDIPKLTSSLNDLKKKVEEEIFEEVKTRANKTISAFADPNSI